MLSLSSSLFCEHQLSPMPFSSCVDPLAPARKACIERMSSRGQLSPRGQPPLCSRLPQGALAARLGRDLSEGHGSSSGVVRGAPCCLPSDQSRSRSVPAPQISTLWQRGSRWPICCSLCGVCSCVRGQCEQAEHLCLRDATVGGFVLLSFCFFALFLST